MLVHVLGLTAHKYVMRSCAHPEANTVGPSMKLDALMHRYRPAFADTWAEALEIVMAYELETRRVDELAAELSAAGRFDFPVVLGFDEVMNGTQIPAAVEDGMHRIFAHVLSGIDDVLVCDLNHAPKEGGWVELEWMLPAPLAESVIEEIVSLGSFRMDEDHWTVMESFGTSDAWMSASVFGAADHLVHKTLAAYSDRLHAAGVSLGPGIARWATDLDDSPAWSVLRSATGQNVN